MLFIPDKGCDRGTFMETINATGAIAVTPSEEAGLQSRQSNKHRCKARTLVERFLKRLKQFQHIALRFQNRT